MRTKEMPVHLEVLKAAQDLCRNRSNHRFKMIEIVHRLPHLNEQTIRTHIGSRCCHNAPVNHLHRWDYFKRVGHGEFEIRPAYRKPSKDTPQRVAEQGVTYGSRVSPAAITTIHAVVTRGAGDDEMWYTAECLEVAVVTQGRTLDELIGNLGEAVRVHIDGDAGRLGVAEAPRVSVIYEMGVPPA